MDGGVKLVVSDAECQNLLQFREMLQTIVSDPNIRAEFEKWPKNHGGVTVKVETVAATTGSEPHCSAGMEGSDVKLKVDPAVTGTARSLNGTDSTRRRHDPTTAPGAMTDKACRSSLRLPSFLKTLTENSLNSWMHIPKVFLELHSSEFDQPGTVKLEGSSGEIWLIATCMIGKGPHGFRQGWKAFITDNHLKKGDQLLFTLVASSHFTVRVFDEAGLEAASTSFVTKTGQFNEGIHNCKIRKERSDNETPAPSSKEKLKRAHDDPRLDNNANAKRFKGELPNPSFQCPDARCAGGSRNSCGCRSKSGLETRLNETKQAAKRSRAEEPCLKAAPGGKKEALKKSSSSKPSNWRGAGGRHMEKFEPGFFSMTWRSQRRPVTETEREQAMSAAHAFQTRNPSVVLLMKPSHVYRGFWLCLPIDFARNWLPKNDTDVTLEDESGYGWPSRWLSNENRQGLSGGWTNFSRDHCLEEGDVCVFEVTDAQRWIIVVHIFRVVDVKIVPGARDGGKGYYKLVKGPGYLKTKTLPSKKNLNRTCSKNPTNNKKRHMWRAPHQDVVTRKQQRSRGLKPPFHEPSRKTTPGEAGTAATKAFDEPDVKPKVVKLEPGAIPKIASTNNNCITFATVKMEKEMVPDIDVKFNVAQAQSEELKPSSYDLRRSNHNHHHVFNNTSFEEKPKVVGASGILKSTENPRKYYRVSRLIDRRKDLNGELQFKVELEQGAAAASVLPKEQQQQCQQQPWTTTKDEEGFWWVPYSQFSSDFRSCSID